MTRRITRIALWSGVGLALTVCGYLLISTTFMPYDDEGYVLISIRNYLAGLRLYDDIFSQYGPWPFAYHELATTLTGQPLTHGFGRMLTLLHWVLASILCGAICWRLTRSQLAAVVASLLTFSLCWQNTSEPSHPGSHIMLLVALAATLASGLPGARHPRTLYAALGVITALLLLTKINVGLLLAAGLGCFALRNTPWPARAQTAAAGLALAGMIALPWVLMGRQLDRGWVQAFTVLFTAATLGVWWTHPLKSEDRRLPARAWLWLPSAGLVAAGLVFLQVCRHGTEAGSLLEAILLSPLRMPAHFTVGLHWYPEVWVLFALGAAIVIKAGFEIRRDGAIARSTGLAVIACRITALVGLAGLARHWPTHTGIFHFSAYCLPLLPVFLLPLARSAANDRLIAAQGVAWVALPQILHAFPVAGSQLAWATFLCVPVFVAGLLETGAALTERWGHAGRTVARGTAALALLVAVFLLGLMGHTGWQRYTHSRPLDLPGAGDIRLDGKTRQAFRLLHLNAMIHADLLFSRQGMFSHNLWSGLPTPTAQNATHWFWLLNATQQQAIIDRLADTPRTALITSQSLDEFMVRENIPFGGPLQDFVRGHYRPLFRYADFTFHVPADSRAVAFGRFELLESPEAAGSLLFRTLVRLDGQPVRIRLEGMEAPWAVGPELLTPPYRGVAEPVDATGQPTGPAVPLPAAQPLRGLYRLSVICPRPPAGLPWQDFLAVVRDPAGRPLSDSAY